MYKRPLGIWRHEKELSHHGRSPDQPCVSKFQSSGPSNSETYHLPKMWDGRLYKGTKVELDGLHSFSNHVLSNCSVLHTVPCPRDVVVNDTDLVTQPEHWNIVPWITYCNYNESLQGRGTNRELCRCYRWAKEPQRPGLARTNHPKEETFSLRAEGSTKLMGR